MVKKGAGLAHTSSLTRATGVALPIVPGPPGTGTVSFALADLPIPSRRFLADRVAVETDGADILVLFGQTKCRGDGLTQLLVARTSADRVLDVVNSCREFGPRVREFLTSSGLNSAPPLAFTADPDPTVKVDFSIAAMVHAGYQASIDLYDLTAWARHDLGRAGATAREATVEPVVRIQLSTAALGTLLDQLAVVAPASAASMDTK